MAFPQVDWARYGEGPGMNLTSPFSGSYPGYMTLPEDPWPVNSGEPRGGGLPVNQLPPVNQYTSTSGRGGGEISGQPSMSPWQTGLLGAGYGNFATKMLFDKSLLDVGKGLFSGVDWGAMSPFGQAASNSGNLVMGGGWGAPMNPFTTGAAGTSTTSSALPAATSIVSGGGAYFPAVSAGQSALGGTAITGYGATTGTGAAAGSTAGAGAAGAGAGAASVAGPLAMAAMAYLGYSRLHNEAEKRKEIMEMVNYIKNTTDRDPEAVLKPAAQNKPFSLYNAGGAQAPMTMALLDNQQPGWVPGLSAEQKQKLEPLRPQASKLQQLNDALFNLEFGPDTNAAQVFNNYVQRGVFKPEDRKIFEDAGYNLNPGMSTAMRGIQMPGA